MIRTIANHLLAHTHRVIVLAILLAFWRTPAVLAQTADCAIPPAAGLEGPVVDPQKGHIGDNCSVYPFDINENKRARHFIDNAFVVPVDNPEVIGQLIGDEDELIRLEGGKQGGVSGEMSVETILNVALDSTLTSEYGAQVFSPQLRYHLSNYDRNNAGLTTATCTAAGINDPRACDAYLNSCLEGTAGCRTNYFEASNTFERTRRVPQQLKAIGERCRTIIGSVAGYLQDEGSPVENVVYVDDDGTTNYEACQVVRDHIDGDADEGLRWFTKLTPAEQAPYYAILQPSVALEYGFLVVATHPNLNPDGEDEEGGFLGWFTSLFTRVEPPRIQIVEFYIPGLEARHAMIEELRLYSPLDKGEKAFQEIDSVSHRPLPDSVPRTIIKQSFEGGRKYQPILDKINDLGVECGSTPEHPSQMMGGVAETQIPEAVDVSWTVRLADKLQDIEAALNQPETVYSYCAWLVLPEQLLEQQEATLGNDYAPIRSFLTLKQQALLESTDVHTPQPLARNNNVSIIISEEYEDTDNPDACEPNPNYRACLELADDPADCPRLMCPKKEVGVQFDDQTAGVYLPIGNPVLKELGVKTALTKLDSPEYFDNPCWPENIFARSVNNLRSILKLPASPSSNCAGFLPNSTTTNQLACTIIDPPYNFGVCGGNPKLGFNYGYGHSPAGNPALCQDSYGKPVTFIIGVGMSTTDMQVYATCFKDAKARIVRVDGWNARTSSTLLAQTAQDIAQVFNTSKDYIVFGNEVNNLAAEYSGCSGGLASCGQSYAVQYNSFRRDLLSACPNCRLSPAPLDTSNSQYDAAAFIQGATDGPAPNPYQNLEFLAANSYQLSSCAFESTRCQAASYRWYAQTVGYGGPIILTEYGLEPFVGDTNLSQVQNFISNPPSDVEYVTPLVRNPCITADSKPSTDDQPVSSGEWLRYNCSGFIDGANQGIDPTSAR